MRRPFLTIILVLLTLVVSASAIPAEPAVAQTRVRTRISWQPQTVRVSMSPGETKTVPIRLKTARALENVRITARGQRTITLDVDQPALTTTEANQEIRLNLKVTLSDDARLLANGSLYVTDASGRRMQSPLPVRVRVVRPTPTRTPVPTRTPTPAPAAGQDEVVDETPQTDDTTATPEETTTAGATDDELMVTPTTSD